MTETRTRRDDLSLDLPGNQHPAVLVPGLKRLLKGSWEQKRWFSLAVLGAVAFALLTREGMVDYLPFSNGPRLEDIALWRR
jgi:hypothetical protein